ncbi:ubiquinol-cytochrome c chaperone [Cystoisospora suis]|uniref:Ubiquinol-cytochrome c chaperone n=1 Tax=Cystoisospora suis TaxID=483139 RepID=A0A2C6KH71_9APIC|nr:ubiquinol-cytochrome c chaperone [Cystoisospora suis]
MSHPFIRPVEGVERRLFVLESQRLLADSFLTAIDPATSAKYVVAIPNEHRAPLPLLIYTYITKHRHHSNTAWKFAHLILERTEAEHLIAAFKIPGGFNGRFYFYMLHLWLVHKRLCLGVNRSMAAETQRNLYLGQRETLRRCKRKTVAESLVTASLGTDSCCPTDQENKSDFFGLNGSEGSLPVPLLHQRVTEDLSGKGTRAGREGQQAHTARQWTYSSELKTALQTGPPGSGAAALIALKELEEEERYLLHGRDELFDEEKVVEGEMIDAALFKITWDVLKDWLQQKHIAEARFEFELRNCQQYAFGFFAGLDEAMTDDEIYAARLKEVLWGNLYSGRISFDDPHLHLLTKYTIRQLTHLMQIHKVYFYRASFSWADFPVSARFPPSRVVPPLAQRVRYGGYVPSLVGDAPSVTAIGGGQISEKLTSGGSDTRRRGIFGRLKQLWRGDSQERSERKN